MNNSESLLPPERQWRILEILARDFTVRSSTLSEMSGVSEMTIRRDFDLLEKRGLVERTHGGAVYKQERLSGKFKYQTSINENLNEKRQIAKKAASLIEPNDVIHLGEGTNTALVLRYVEPGLPFSIFTNNSGGPKTRRIPCGMGKKGRPELSTSTFK